MRSCKECIHWNQDEINSGEGECRINPPQSFLTVSPNPLGGYTQSLVCVFPRTKSFTWCSKFEPKHIS